MLVYKYYSAKWGRDAISKSRLKISRIDELNDPFDFFSLAPKTKQQRFMFEKAIQLASNSFGIISTSLSYREPLLWSHYADNHRGICLELEIDPKLGSEVIYQKNRHAFNLDLNLSIEAFHYMKLYENYKTKYIKWRYEKEFRLFMLEKNIDNKQICFRPFDRKIRLNRVLLGPRYKQIDSPLNKKMKALGIPVVTTR